MRRRREISQTVERRSLDRWSVEERMYQADLLGRLTGEKKRKKLRGRQSGSFPARRLPQIRTFKEVIGKGP